VVINFTLRVISYALREHFYSTGVFNEDHHMIVICFVVQATSLNYNSKTNIRPNLLVSVS
jgi:hypothetical protein